MNSIKNKSNYSYKTSLPAYLDNTKGKDNQERLVLYVMRRFKSNRSTLKEIQDYLRKHLKVYLPQSTISGRMGDLRDKGRVVDTGTTKFYKDYQRKVFEVVTAITKRKKKIKVVKKRKPVVKPSKFYKADRIFMIELNNGAIYYSTTGRSWSKAKPKNKKPFGHSLKKKKK